MSERSTPQQEPISDSPWFWLYLFATVALILLISFQGKLDIRQANIERQHQARQLAHPADEITNQTPVAVSSPGDTLIGWNYLVVVLGVLVAVGWIRLWYVRFRVFGKETPETSTPR
ncbi:hypothetical protein [Bremerella alba]|uniref:Uncharacterized protein n=1 Tax=Bremerella alba TaxID=980252 RepID=A0A7V9A792_9BACT|nr:hypothetical protein [Bremerella alba]MBA2115103.1 hypothetical protein [Bremerella alba]